MPPSVRERLPHAGDARYQAGNKNGASPACVQNQDQLLPSHRVLVLKRNEDLSSMPSLAMDVPQ